MQVGGWIFELKQVRAFKAENFGEAYSANALITITDGTAHVENLMMRFDEQFTRQDYQAFKTFIENAGFDSAAFSQIKNGERLVKEERCKNDNSKNAITIC